MKETSGVELSGIVYQPELKETVLVRFSKLVEEKYNIKIKDYWDLYAWSIKNYPEFWDCVWQYFDVAHFQRHTEVFDRKKRFTNMEWFKGARINYAANVLKYRDSHMAVIACDEDDNVEYITYEQLYDEVKLYIQALKDAGVGKGDVVGVYMSNKQEAIPAYLATASIGAMFCGALPLLGVKGAISRFAAVNPKVLFTGGNFSFEDSEIKMMQKIPLLVEALPDLKKVIFVPSKTKEKRESIENIPKCVYISDFLDEARNKLKDNTKDIEYEEVPFDHPLCISFTSGTTGPPKKLIHSHGNFFTSLRDYGLHQDITRKDVLFNFSPMGWISWNMFVNTLHLGSTLVMYEGYPFEASPTRYWDLVDKFGITSSYIWSSTVENLESKGYGPTPNHSLKTLKNLSPMGSPTKPHCYNFLAKKIKPGLFFCPVYGCTEVYGLLSGVDSNLPIYRGELQVPALAMDLKIVNEKGEPIVGKRGEVILDTPYPALPTEVLNHENKLVTEELYLKQFPGSWYVGDDAWMNPETKGLIVFGRSDETMNPKGARFNCSEIYFALEGFPGIMDSVCTSQYNSDMDERVVLFVKMSPGHTLTSEVKEKIKKTIEESLTIEHVPEVVMEVPDIPYNLTGKKLNGLVKKLVNKKTVLNSEVVINPKSIEFFKIVDLGEF